MQENTKIYNLQLINKTIGQSWMSAPANHPNDDDKIIDDGFSSEEELKHEEIIVEDHKKETPQSHYKEEVKFKIPPPQEIKDKPYSLKPDIATGWASKIELPNPIPIIFDNERFDSLIRKVIKHPKNKAKLCYLGPRYQNTYYAWYDKRFSFPYDHIKAPTDMKFTNRPFCGQHWQAEEGLIFDSFFESGNLDCVIQVGEREYDLFMRVDSNTAGHLQWFNFKIRNIKKLLKYKLNICNFQKDKSLFARGMKPYIYSEKKFKKEKISWEQAGENVRFEKKGVSAARLYEFQMRQLYRLSFEYYTQYEGDQIQIAYCIPYTYSRLSQFLHSQLHKAENKGFLKMSKLCNSLGGLQIPLLIIHEKAQQKQGEKKQTNYELDQVQKKCVVISGRAHPGESNGSHMMEGFIQFLCGQSKMAVFLRKHIVFKIVPMLNPDGVALGNYRTGLSGKDFNRQYKNPDRVIFPEVYHFKKLVSQNKMIFKENLIMFLDFHGHSTKKNTFMYGPEFPIIDKYYYESRIFPKLLSNHTSMFRYYSCIFKINQFKQTTARAVLMRRIYVPLSYTIQTSNGSYFDYEKLKDVPYTEALWKQMGNKIGFALHQYADLVVTAEKNRIEKINNKKRTRELIKKGGKNGKKGMHSQQQQVRESQSIFTGMENQKIKMLFEEIKKAQQKKHLEKVSDDELSEGSSDREDQRDDLSPTKSSYLYQIIKNKNFKSLSRCRLRHKKQIEQSEDIHFKTNGSEAQTIQRIPIQQEVNDGRISQEIFRKKHHKIHVRKPVTSKERLFNFESSQDKKISTAKIINFSFCSNSPKRGRNSLDKNNKVFLPSKLNFLELVAGKWSQQKNRQRKQPSKKDSKAVCDLSDNNFRKTFTHNLRERANEEIERMGEYNATYIPNKRVGRFQHYKYRRLLINSQFQQTSGGQ